MSEKLVNGSYLFGAEEYIYVVSQHYDKHFSYGF